MTAYTAQYISANIQELFLDKETGTPMGFGYVYFYKDRARNVKKPVFQLTGSAPNYTVTELPNPLRLTSIGSTGNADGDDINILYYPYDENGNLELYYIVVKNKYEEPQFTREAYPPGFGITNSVVAVNFDNYIANGQFIFHTDLPNGGLISAEKTSIAQGGWYFRRSAGSTATDKVTFDQFGLVGTQENGYPRYAVVVECTSASLDAFKEIGVEFQDVNKFATDGAPESTQDYTFSFTASATVQTEVDLYLIKNFGTGGSTETQTLLQKFTITTSEAQYTKSFNFGNNSGKIIGTLDDDYVALALRFPANVSFNPIKFSSFILALGDISGSTIHYPPTTNAKMISESNAGYLPVPRTDGSDLYLPIIFTQTGFKFDDTAIGSVMWTTRGGLPASKNVLAFDNTRYKTSGYSGLGIPYSRLQSVLYNSTYNVPVFGTGPAYFTAYADGDYFYLINNDAGSVTATSNGAVSPGFTIDQISVGAPNIDINSYIVLSGASGGILYTEGKVLGLANDAADGASATGFSFSAIISGDDTYHMNKLTMNAASTLTGGDYWHLYNTTIANYLVYYTVDGAGAPPFGTTIKVAVRSTDTAYIVALKTMCAINGWNAYRVGGVAGAAIPAGSYILASAVGEDFYIWFTVDGVGVNPNVASRTGIKVDLLSDDTAAQVATKIRNTINSAYFCVPNIQGYFPRILDVSEAHDPDAGSRLSNIPGIPGGAIVGTYEYSTNQSHRHSSLIPEGALAGVNAYINDKNRTTDLTVNSSYQGAQESRPRNINLNAFIVY